MPNTELAEELLQLEEADAWFEYLEATTGADRDALRGGRALGVGAALAAPTSGQSAALASPTGCCLRGAVELTPRRVRAAGTPRSERRRGRLVRFGQVLWP